MHRTIGITLLAICLVAFGSVGAWAVDNGSGLGADSAHNTNPTTAQGVCAKCHVPHGGQGDKIWASDPTVQADYAGVQQLCNTCHYSGNPVSANWYPVFNPGAGVMNHVMHDWADTTTALISPAYDSALFPLDTTDTYTTNLPWGGTDPDGFVGNDGFYCGSCHNPHRQPVLDGAASEDANGDYLRAAAATTLAAFGGSNSRLGACTQCHGAVFTAGAALGHEGNCSTCHDPHEGLNVVDGTPTGDQLAEKILIVSGGVPPVFPPNVPGWAAGSFPGALAGICVDCHEDATGAVGSLPVGSTKIINDTTEHHPMGTNAPNATDQGDHAPGYTGLGGGELGCTGCHDMHDATQDYYLDQAFPWTAQDDATFCVTCHTQNPLANLGAAGSDHSQTSTWVDGNLAADTGGRGECMFCHYIHDGNPSTAAAPGDDPSEDSMMRNDAINFLWADIAGDGDLLDYEDMCFGCHADAAITGAPGAGSSFADTLTANTADWFSHRTNSTPSAVGDNPVATLAAGAGLPMWDETTPDIHAYGDPTAGTTTIDGAMFCGTCHVVHVQNTTDSDGNYFRVDHNTGAVRSGLCIACHGAQPMDSTGSSGVGASVTHPTGAGAILPTDPITANPVDAQYGNGGDGYLGGRTSGNTPNTGADATGQMQCETCHNFHNSQTNHAGGSADHSTAATNPEGKLMIINNASSGLCGTCHAAY